MDRADMVAYAAQQRPSSGKRVIGRPFRPGQSGNPRGRKPRGFTLAELVRTHADHRKTGKGKTRLELLLDRLYEEYPLAYLAYGWGKPVESLELSEPQSPPVVFSVALAEEDLP